MSLIVSDVTDSDAGSYRLVATNPGGESHATINVKFDSKIQAIAFHYFQAFKLSGQGGSVFLAEVRHYIQRGP